MRRALAAAVAVRRAALGLAARLFVVALPSLAACDAEPGAGLDPFPSDGVSAFGEPRLVRVCIGSAAVAPGPAQSVCVPETATFTACGADAECSGAERCLCGRCFVRACDAASVCPSGEACRGGRCAPVCSEDTECAQGEVCSGGGCARPCQSDAACASGEVCDLFGTCAARACSGVTGCGPGHECEPVSLSGQVREPAPVEIDGERLAFFELGTPAGSSVYRARFEGPLLLVADPAEPVLAPPEGHSRVGAPSVVVRAGEVDLFATLGDGAALGLARSTDRGRTFTWVTATLLEPSEAWESGRVASPAAFEHDGATFFFYEGGSGAGIGLAKVSGDAAQRASSGPVLRPIDLEDASSWRSVQAIGTPYALVSDGIVRVYVTARGVEGGTATTPSGPVEPEPNDSIGMFATADLATFDRYPAGPVYTTISGLFGALGEREPAVSLGDSGADLYFVATDALGAEPSGLSRASTVK